MVVSSRCQGLGVGKKLLQAAFDFGENCGYEEGVLGTTHNHKEAINFYVKNGFDVINMAWIFHYMVPFRKYRLQYGLRARAKMD